MELLVTGIAPSGDAAEVLQRLAGSGLDASRLSAVTKATAQARMDHGGHGGGSLSAASTITTGSGGTGVPGVGGSHASLSSFRGHGSAPDYLGGVPLIPPDQAENFNIAIAEGRALVMYKASADEAPQAQDALRAAGLRNVKIFKPKVLEEHLG